MRLTRTDGSVEVKRQSGFGVPLQFSQLIFVPDPKATRLTLEIYPEGDRQQNPLKLDVSLKSVTNGAIYTDPGLKPFDPQTGIPEIDPGDYVPSADTQPDKIAVVKAQSPLTIRNMLGAKGIRAIAAARSVTGAWLFGRSRFYVFDDNGTSVLTIGNNPVQTSKSFLDTRTVDSPLHIADGTNAVFALCGSQVVRFSGTNVLTVADGIPGDRLAWSPKNNTLIAGNTDDNACLHIPLSAPGAAYTTDLVIDNATDAPRNWLTAGRHAYAATTDGLTSLTHTCADGPDPFGQGTVHTEGYDADDKDSNPAMTTILYHAIHTAPDRTPLPHKLKLDISAAQANMAVRLSRLNNNGKITPITTWHVNGQIKSPLQLTLPRAAAYPPQNLLLTISGKLKAGSNIVSGHK